MTSPGWRIPTGIAIVAATALLAAACGSSEDETQTSADQPPSAEATSAPTEDAGTTPPEGEEPTEETTADATAAPTLDEPEPEVPDSDATVAPSESTIPRSSDPCSSPADHVIGAGETEYTLAFGGQDLPVGVRVGGDPALTDESIMFVVLHGASMSWDMTLWMVDSFLARYDDSPESHVSVFAQASPAGEPGFWSQSETFNTDYLETLFTNLSDSFCMDRTKVVLAGLAQGSIAAVQGFCQADLPIDLLVLFVGMAKLVECSPTHATPIISIDTFEFDPLIGGHWDGSWNPPVALEVELTGGIDATPDDLGVWAGLYNCPDEPAEVTLPDEADLLERDSVALVHEGCDAALVAVGQQDALFADPDTEPVLVVDEFLRPHFQAALAE